MDLEPEDHPETPEELPPVRRSFPVPVRRPRFEEDAAEDAPGPFSGWLVRAVVALAVIMAGWAAWVKLGPAPSGAPQVARPASPSPPAPPPGPPDAAQDIYLMPPPAEAAPLLPPPVENPPAVAEAGPLPPEVVDIPPPDTREGDAAFDMLGKPPADPPPAETVAATDTPPETPPAAPEPPPVAVALGPLEQKYLAALQRTAPSAPPAELPAWLAEITRVKSGQPLPATADGLPESLARLQSIYRREQERAALAPDARELEFFIRCEGPVKFYHNGKPVGTSLLYGSGDAASISKATLSLRQGDVLGFELPPNRTLAVVARAGVRTKIATSETWEAVNAPSPEFWTGGAVSRTRVYREKPGYRPGMPAVFEEKAGVHSADYSTIWGSGAGSVGFRYVVRKSDLPERK